jgi:hypothetical protein
MRTVSRTAFDPTGRMIGTQIGNYRHGEPKRDDGRNDLSRTGCVASSQVTLLMVPVKLCRWMETSKKPGSFGGFVIR